MKKSTSNNKLNSQVVNSLVSKKRLEVYMEYAKARANAKESRDEKIMKKITKLEKELIKLEKKAEKTIDPMLKKQMIKAQHSYLMMRKKS